ncbi:soyasapogenol B glucuronide galactosyltransferase-like [Triticum aestivum]|uniref:soyasapogenol B glucuronide galactosyltransferase-like n=1 Tax=Triticum aestivum TaxID=4565 RepID=UPI001D029FA7|nr:soyasapogenol B glucuronide galactosyltransferase-like [Triticum aestivum]
MRIVGPITHTRHVCLFLSELHQLARALGLSGLNFVWVIGAAAGQESSEWMPEGFADLIASGDRDFMVRGWAPEMLILSHPALGGFVTHCGWNSVLEAVTAGVPMATWPRYGDHFNNKTLVVEQLKVGVSIGAKDYASGIEAHDVIAGEVTAESIQRLMESDAIRKKAKDHGVKARSMVEKGGSSYDDVARLMGELTARRSSVKVGEDIQAS